MKGKVRAHRLRSSPLPATESRPLAVHGPAADDALTGLANRALFLDRLRSLAATGSPLAVLFLDLDDFKLVNDGWGHETGDRLLCEVADRLRSAVRPGDLVARLGGDEFTVLCEGVSGEREALAIAGRLREALVEPFEIAGQRRLVRASIGCRVATARGCPKGHRSTRNGPLGGAPDEFTAEALLRDADVAMYQAKDKGRNRIELYSEETRKRIVRRLEVEQELRSALETGGLAVHYQPQVDLLTGSVVGVEALARWKHPRLGDVSPAEFIAVAEETGLIGPLGSLVLEQTCRQLAAWHSQGLRIAATVNVSAHQLDDPGFADDVARHIGAAGLPPSSICLELTESALMGAGADPRRVLTSLKGLGVYVAIDDFGTGYSSLASLKRLPVEVVKVDRSFVDGLGTDPEDSAIVAAILSLAHAMGLHVVAEGVETPLQAAELVALGCTVGQGFLWSAAVPAGRFVALAAELEGAGGHGAAGAPWTGERYFIDEMLHQIGIAKEAL
jgi:diguanylate cyclase (GGDEF)-like protein